MSYVSSVGRVQRQFADLQLEENEPAAETGCVFVSPVFTGFFLLCACVAECITRYHANQSVKLVSSVDSYTSYVMAEHGRIQNGIKKKKLYVVCSNEETKNAFVAE